MIRLDALGGKTGSEVLDDLKAQYIVAFFILLADKAGSRAIPADLNARISARFADEWCKAFEIEIVKGRTAPIITSVAEHCVLSRRFTALPEVNTAILGETPSVPLDDWVRGYFQKLRRAGAPGKYENRDQGDKRVPHVVRLEWSRQADQDHLCRVCSRRGEASATRSRVPRARARRLRWHCTISELPERRLLHATRILPDRDRRGQPVVSNGIAISVIHRFAHEALKILSIHDALARSYSSRSASYLS